MCCCWCLERSQSCPGNDKPPANKNTGEHFQVTLPQHRNLQGHRREVTPTASIVLLVCCLSSRGGESLPHSYTPDGDQTGNNTGDGLVSVWSSVWSSVRSPVGSAYGMCGAGPRDLKDKGSGSRAAERPRYRPQLCTATSLSCKDIIWTWSAASMVFSNHRMISACPTTHARIGKPM